MENIDDFNKPNSRPIKIFLLCLGILIVLVGLGFLYTQLYPKQEDTHNDFIYNPDPQGLDISRYQESTTTSENVLPITKADEGYYAYNHEIVYFGSDESDPNYNPETGDAQGDVNDSFIIEKFKGDSFNFCMTTVTTNFHSCQIEGIAKKSPNSEEFIFVTPPEEMTFDPNPTENSDYPDKIGPCTLAIKKVKSPTNETEIVFEEKQGYCEYYCGARASLGGTSFNIADKKSEKKDCSLIDL